MIIGERLRALREEKKFSQGEIEKRTGLLRCYISRVEHGYTVPAVETLEKFARALEVPMYQLFYDGEKPPKVLDFPKKSDEKLFGASGQDAKMLLKFRRFLGKTDAKNRGILLLMAAKMARPHSSKFASHATVLIPTHVNFWTDHIFLFRNNCVKHRQVRSPHFQPVPPR